MCLLAYWTTLTRLGICLLACWTTQTCIGTCFTLGDILGGLVDASDQQTIILRGLGVWDACGDTFWQWNAILGCLSILDTSRNTFWECTWSFFLFSLSFQPAPHLKTLHRRSNDMWDTIKHQSL